MAEALKRPGGELASRPLHFFWVVDCSGSMYGEKIGTVNHAIQSTIPEMVDAAKDNPNAQLLVRTLKFSTGATWVTPDPVNIEDFAWDDLDAGGVTDLGKAFEMLAAQLTIPPMTDRALPPVIVLLSDGQPTDDYKKSLDMFWWTAAMTATRWNTSTRSWIRTWKRLIRRHVRLTIVCRCCSGFHGIGGSADEII